MFSNCAKEFLPTKQMAESRFFDDPFRIQKRLELAQGPGNYYLNVPGPGTELPLEDDVHVRMQRWGANIMTNTVNLESDLLGITRGINRHATDAILYDVAKPKTTPLSFPVQNPFVEESRASHPAWMYKDLEHSHWSFPQLNPQNLATIEQPFLYDVQTRILQRDNQDQHPDRSPPPFEPRNIFPLAGQQGDLTHQAIPPAAFRRQ